MPAAPLHTWERGAGPPAVLCLHETGTDGAVWEPLAGELGSSARLIACDRRGWGASPAPEGYARTTVGEQGADAAEVLEAAGAAPALICGAGLGAVVALELAVHRPELVAGVAAIEPPLLAFLPDATELIAADAETIREAIAAGGREAVLDLYLSGGLRALGAGAERLPPATRARGPSAVAALIAELGAVPAWPLPLPELAALSIPVAVVVGSSTPPILNRAATALASALAAGEPRRLRAAGLPHCDGAAELAELLAGLA